MRIHQVLGWNALDELLLNLQWRFARRKATAIAQPKDVSVNCHRRLAKR